MGKSIVPDVRGERDTYNSDVLPRCRWIYALEVFRNCLTFATRGLISNWACTSCCGHRIQAAVKRSITSGPYAQRQRNSRRHNTLPSSDGSIATCKFSRWPGSFSRAQQVEVMPRALQVGRHSIDDSCYLQDGRSTGLHGWQCRLLSTPVSEFS